LLGGAARQRLVDHRAREAGGGREVGGEGPRRRGGVAGGAVEPPRLADDEAGGTLCTSQRSDGGDRLAIVAPGERGER